MVFFYEERDVLMIQLGESHVKLLVQRLEVDKKNASISSIHEFIMNDYQFII
jgi:hypothetical protein